MSKGVQIGILFLIGIAAIGFIVFFVFLRNPSFDLANSPRAVFDGSQDFPNGLEEVIDATIPSSNTLVEETLSDEKGDEVLKGTQGDLSRLAFAFVERFGSYSSQSRFQNIRDLEVFMTDEMIIWARNFILENDGEDGGGSIRVTTVALAVKEFKLASDAMEAFFLITTQRQERQGAFPTVRVYYQDIALTLVKEDSLEWKVRSALWQ